MDLRRVYGRYLLKDNRPVSDLDYQNVFTLREKIVQTVENRESIVRADGLDPDFCLPDANWIDSPDNDFFEAYRYVAKGSAEAISHLRFYVQAYSGFQLFSMTPAHGLKSVNEIPPNYDDWISKLHPKPDYWVDRWIYLVEKIPFDLIYSPPKMLGEIGWNVGGIVVNHDTYIYQEKINILFENGIMDWLQDLPSKRQRPRILEVGGGYGALASILQKLVRNSQYFICDLPESLLFSGCYLQLTQAGRSVFVCQNEEDLKKSADYDFVLLPNYLFQKIVDSDLNFDFAINTWSLSEMSDHQVRTYGQGISKLIGNEGIFFEQNEDNRGKGFNYCCELLSKHFSDKADLKTNSCFSRRWIPHVWSNFPSNNYLKHLEQFSKPVEVPQPALGQRISNKLNRWKTRWLGCFSSRN